MFVQHGDRQLRGLLAGSGQRTTCTTGQKVWISLNVFFKADVYSTWVLTLSETIWFAATDEYMEKSREKHKKQHQQYYSKITFENASTPLVSSIMNMISSKWEWKVFWPKLKNIWGRTCHVTTEINGHATAKQHCVQCTIQQDVWCLLEWLYLVTRD